MLTSTRLLYAVLGWAVIGFAIGLALGVTSISVWLLTLGLVVFIVYLKLNGEADPETEGALLAGGVALMLSWLGGFVVHGVLF